MEYMYLQCVYFGCFQLPTGVTGQFLVAVVLIFFNRVAVYLVSWIWA